MGDLPGVGGIWRTLVGEWEKNLIIFIFVFELMGGDRARWEIYLLSEECRGRWWDSGKKFNYFYICICIRILIQICIWIRGRWRTGDNGRAQVREGWRRGRGRVKKGP